MPINLVQVFKAKGLRHPSAGLHLAVGSTFVPNDVELGGGRAPFIILTGPNMGGERLSPTLRLSMAPEAAKSEKHMAKAAPKWQSLCFLTSGLKA